MLTLRSVYLIGSLRNPEIPKIADRLRRELGIEVFDDWFAAGPIADDSWRDYEKARGRDYPTALRGYAAKHVFDFDYTHLTRTEGAVLALPAGRSAHLEFGWMIGRGKPGWVLMDNPERWDVMNQFATGVHQTIEELIAGIQAYGRLARGTDRAVDAGHSAGAYPLKGLSTGIRSTPLSPLVAIRPTSEPYGD